MTEQKLISFSELRGKKQIKEICLLILEKAKIVNFSGRYVRINGKRFYRQHLYYARQTIRNLRKAKRREEFKKIIGITADKPRSMMGLVYDLFEGV